MSNVIPLDLRSRLIRLGFNEADVDACVATLGPDASLDLATHWLGVRALETIFRKCGFVRVDSEAADSTWEWRP